VVVEAGLPIALIRRDDNASRPACDAQDFEDRPASLLDRATKLSPARMLRDRLAHREATLMSTLAIALFYTAVFIGTAPWPLLWARLLVSLGVG
jgi:hypothetical protein